jgi:hypothetical protein
MAKLNEIIYDIREAVKEFSDDTELDDRYLAYQINIKRAKYLRQDLNNFQKTTDTSVQQSFCVDLEEVSVNDCEVDLTCEKITRTKLVLPKAIELHTRPAFTSIRPLKKLSVKFNFISKDKAPYLEHAMFGNSIYAFLDVDNRVYLISNSDTHKLIDCISITGVFEDPLALSAFKDCCNCSPEESNSCYDQATEDYPLQPHYVDVIKSEIINDLLKLKAVREDKINDANDSEQ